MYVTPSKAIYTEHAALRSLGVKEMEQFLNISTLLKHLANETVYYCSLIKVIDNIILLASLSIVFVEDTSAVVVNNLIIWYAK